MKFKLKNLDTHKYNDLNLLKFVQEPSQIKPIKYLVTQLSQSDHQL